MRQNTDLHQDKCFLEERNIALPTNEPALFFIMDFRRLRVNVSCSRNWRNMNVYGEFKNENSKFNCYINTRLQVTIVVSS